MEAFSNSQASLSRAKQSDGKKRGICQICEKEWNLNSDGMIRQHKHNSGRCLGSWGVPKENTTCIDPRKQLWATPLPTPAQH
ncbi:hypothetical protein Hamer_G013495 [Homarus americanus]|uniref:Uncharacterized protein n=1 Tax=Homarus americanus TaxID=6706 RepID=A0A8J5N0D9_HOMAM|nr:hypothetical protein Hamer_G013495 [Homarus americanus]